MVRRLEEPSRNTKAAQTCPARYFLRGSRALPVLTMKETECAPLNILFIKFRKFHQMPEQAGFQWFCAMNWHGKPHNRAIFAINMVAASNAQKLPAALFKCASQRFAGDFLQSAPLLNSNFKNAMLRSNCGRNIHRQAPCNRLAQIHQQFFHGFAFCGAARDGGDFGPKSAFFRFVNYYFNFQLI